MNTKCSLILASLILGCSTEAPDLVGGLACSYAEWESHVDVSSPEVTDILFVIDNSASMALHRGTTRQLVSELVGLFAEEARPASDDRGLDFGQDLHVGVISGDLGYPAEQVPAGCSALGDDGLLQAPEACGASPGGHAYAWAYPRFHDGQEMLSTVSCRADLPGDGCALSQPLEAVLRALSPASSSGDGLDALSVLDGHGGHGEGGNVGFYRDDPDKGGELLIVIVTDGDDCSVADSQYFATNESSVITSVREKCIDQASMLSDVQRYAERLSALQPQRSYRVSVDIVAVIPQDLVDALRNPDEALEEAYARVLADPRMQLTSAPEADMPDTLLLAPCSNEERASATPPRRLLEFARELGHQAHIHSLCSPELAQTIHARHSFRFGHGQVLGFPRRFPRNHAGYVDCQMTWTLPPVADPGSPATPTHCDERPGFLSRPPSDRPQVADNGGALCEVRQVPAPADTEGMAQLAAGEGFFYRELEWDGEGSWFDLTEHASPPPHIDIEFRCGSQAPREAPLAANKVEVTPRTGRNRPTPPPEPRVGDLCDGQSRGKTTVSAEYGSRGDAWCHMGVTPEPLFCHPQKNICVRACQFDQDCLPGWLCDTDSTPLSQTAGQAICINPAC